MKIWLNDRIASAADIEIDEDGWPTGDGIFETIRTEKGMVYELARHMRRAATAAKNFGIKLPNEDLVRTAIYQVLTTEPFELGRLRLLFSKDRFVAVHQPYLEIDQPARLQIADASNDIESISFKTFPYSHRINLLAKAKASGYDEIICLSPEGEVTEGAVSNYIFLIDGIWVTTPLSAGVLPGVQRGIVIERAGVSVKSIMKSDLDRVTSALVISSLKIALPVLSINDRVLEIGQKSKDLIANIRSQTQRHSVG